MVTNYYSKDMDHCRCDLYWEVSAVTQQSKHAFLVIVKNFWWSHRVSTFRSPKVNCKLASWPVYMLPQRTHPPSHSSLSKQELGHVWPAVWLWVKVRVVCFPDYDNSWFKNTSTGGFIRNLVTNKPHCKKSRWPLTCLISWIVASRGTSNWI